jgi:hypothetical protein
MHNGRVAPTGARPTPGYGDRPHPTTGRLDPSGPPTGRDNSDQRRGAGMTETPFESPPEDAADQRTEVAPDPERDAPAAGEWVDVSLEADPADAQAHDAEVPIDEDEWR